MDSSAETRRVLFIGLCGPSCAGKSTLAVELARRLDSPLRPVPLDAYFVPSRMPFDKWGLNWETPEGVDFVSLREDLQMLAATLQESKEVPEELCIRGWGVGGGNFVRKGCAGRRLQSPVVLLAEGFLLFHDEALSRLFDATLWVEAACEVCCSRRHAREARGADFELYSQWYREVVWAHFQRYREGQLAHAPRALRLEGEDALEVSVEKAAAHCEERLSLRRGSFEGLYE
eukprot:CAMPEP_0171062570 /NCGR_PEP_ID=MMETSP0766_2-20121228/5124_1 /TAXON_ID=439317 /ORGANISM="Gambierdiscus australes, Strain CAWD 149" /LENGTH=230 /DNA_ID=CAMNT_0011518369 /DNA_START=73 /DNA_END=765 /DNA_ORIENTATION=-